ncbi:putative streptomycin phosphotransferase [Actinoplanes cyaneus]|uniref:Streptomycin phosphotransferase n=1 Tax=Actinoplanes cyaneus TaxID=52696 RepID=A0A919IU94_9ACTN|nr:APH(3') family aminoglycoside O-phosphotransferase [Actinoplanes cyaneus]MCW2143892.1 kanamycin kinase [Actinoplanes cyaneus]GID70607.1 putative streptomycin phosphotransferase [Actinoplanes cyaneus]
MWETVTIGESGATVTVDRRNGLYRKVSDDPRDDLVGEGARLTWLREHGIPAAEVIECRPGLLVTAEVPGVSAAGEWPEASCPRVVDALAGLTRALHSLPITDCPFDRRLAVVIPEALAADVDLDDLDDERAGWTRDELAAELISTRPPDEDLVVCHGDLCPPNVVLDPDTCRVNGLIDAGRLGVADRWADLALVTRSLTDDSDPQYGAWAADRFLKKYGVAPHPRKNDFYRLLDEFF